MKKVAYFTVFSLTAALLAVLFGVMSNDTTEIEYQDTVYLRFSFLLKNKGEQAVVGKDMKIFSPYLETERQKLINYSSNVDMDVVKEKYDGYSFQVGELNIPPYGSKSIAVTMEIMASSDDVSVKSGDARKYLVNDHFLDMGSTEVKELAAKVSGGAIDEVAKNIFAWLVGNVKSAGYVAEAKGARFAITQKVGDCTEFMHAFIALARLNNIPARGVGGFVVENSSTVLHANDYHNWAEYYNGDNWVVVDPQNNVLGDLKEKKYVVFRYLGDDRGADRMSQRFLGTNSNLEISML